MCLVADGLRLGAPDRDALSGIVRESSDSSVLILDPSWAFPSEAAAVVDWSDASLENVTATTPLGHLEVHLFGPSCRWGLAAHPEGFAVFAAERALFEMFVAAAGGHESLLERYAAHESSIGFGDTGTQYREQLRRMVGWQAA
jgi:hypothetical protein